MIRNQSESSISENSAEKTFASRKSRDWAELGRTRVLLLRNLPAHVTEPRIRSFFSELVEGLRLPHPETISFIASFRTAYITFPDVETVAAILEVKLIRNTPQGSIWVKGLEWKASTTERLSIPSLMWTRRESPGPVSAALSVIMPFGKSVSNAN